MRKLTVGACTVLAVVLAGMPGVARGNPTLDQSFTEPSSLGGAINECCAYIGQTFTAGRDGMLSGVNIDVVARPGGTLPLNVGIRPVDSSGFPTSAVLGETALSSGSSPLTQLITFPQRIYISAGTQYAIVVNYQGAPPQGPDQMQGTWVGAPGDPYPGGLAVRSYDNGASWLANDEGDYHFQTYVREVPALVGTQQIQPDVDSNPAGTAEAFQYTAPGSGSATELSVYLDSTSTATKVIVGLYTNKATGHPGSLLTSGTITSPVAGAWNTVTVPGTSVHAGTDYWLAILTPDGAGTVKFRDVPNGEGGRTETNAQRSPTSAMSLPKSWRSGTQYANSPASLNATAG